MTYKIIRKNTIKNTEKKIIIIFIVCSIFLLLTRFTLGSVSTMATNANEQSSIGQDPSGLWGVSILFHGAYVNYTISIVNLSTCLTSLNEVYIVDNNYYVLYSTTNISSNNAFFSDNMHLHNNTLYYILVDSSNRCWNSEDIYHIGLVDDNYISWSSYAGVNTMSHILLSIPAYQRVMNIYALNYSETLQPNLPPTAPILISPNCSSEYTISINPSTYSTPIFYNWLSSNSTNPLYYNVNMYDSVGNLLEDVCQTSIGDNITNCTQYIDSSSFNLGNYYYNVTACDTNSLCNESISCNFYVCMNNWIANNNSCLNSNKLISYYDSNNCNAQYDIPLDNGTYTSCTIPNTNSTQYNKDILNGLYVIILLFLALIFILFRKQKQEEEND